VPERKLSVSCAAASSPYQEVASNHDLLVTVSLAQLRADFRARLLTQEEYDTIVRLLLAALDSDSSPRQVPDCHVSPGSPHSVCDGMRDRDPRRVEIETWQRRHPLELLGFLAREYLRGGLDRERYVALRQGVGVVAILTTQCADAAPRR
jgi:hypothetical protein